jgi:hypothetical protein
MLLESAQSLDEAQVHRAAPAPTQTAPAPAAPLKSLSQFEGVEFGLVIDTETGAMVEACALENPAVAIAWTRNTLEQFRELGTVLQVGALGQVSGSGPQHQVLLAMRGNQAFCVGFSRAHPAARAQATLNSILAQWDD